MTPTEVWSFDLEQGRREIHASPWKQDPKGHARVCRVRSPPGLTETTKPAPLSSSSSSNSTCFLDRGRLRIGKIRARTLRVAACGKRA